MGQLHYYKKTFGYVKDFNPVKVGRKLQRIKSNGSCLGCAYENQGCAKYELCENKKYILIEDK